MSADEHLAVFLQDEQVATLTGLGAGLAALDFTEEALLAHGPGARRLSLSLPFSWETVGPLEARPYFEGLLPEGAARERVAQLLRISSVDLFGLLRELGRDCAGAVSLVPQGERPPTSAGSVRWLTEDELLVAIERLPEAPLGVDEGGRVRLSLAGVQDKLVVCVRGDALGLPLEGTPSTHILKPQSAQRGRAGTLRFPDLVENEAFCMRLAAVAGLAAAPVSIRMLGDEAGLLVERFDREPVGDGIGRVHQEDACQALGIDPLAKYEEHGGPSLARIAELLREFSARPLPDTYALLDLAVFNLLIGNCDAHGKNVALLHTGGAIRLAPAYDLVSTAIYPALSTRLAMRVGGVADLESVRLDDVVVEYGACGIGPGVARRRVKEVIERVVAALEPALEVAAQEGWRTEVVERVARRVSTSAASLA